MAGKRKPAIEPRIGIGDDIAKVLVKALGGGVSKAKKSQAARIVGRMGNKTQAAQIRSKAGKLSGQIARSKTKRRAIEETSRMSKAHMSRMSKAGRNWDGSIKKGK